MCHPQTLYAQVTIDKTTMLATVQAGTLFDTYLRVTTEAGVHSPTGVCPSVGVAGFTLGGGIGWTSRSGGLGCDRVVSMRMVTLDDPTNTRVITVTNTSDPDLFWALRGGGGANFGVVTSFTSALSVQPAEQLFLYSLFSFPFDVALNVTDLYFSFHDRHPAFSFFCLFVMEDKPTVLLQG